MIQKESLIDLLLKTGVAENESAAKELIDATEEKKIAIPETTKIFTGEAFTKATENIKNDGIKIGKELVVKDMKEEVGLEFEGKNYKKFIEEYKTHVLKEEGKTVDEKVKSRDKTINELKEALTKEQKEKTEAINSQMQVKKDYELIKSLPKDRDPRFSDQQYITLLKSEMEFGEEEGKPVVKMKGEILKDGQFNPIPYEAAIKQHFEQAKWIKTEEGSGGQGAGGRGAGSSSGGGATGKFNSLKELNAHLEKENIHIGSAKASELLKAALKENPEMSMDLS